MPYDQVPAFVSRLRETAGITAMALEFTILTAARAGEATGAVWSEIDRENALWIIPKGRMKGGKEHRVPLSSRAVAILNELHAIRRSDLVFPSVRGNVSITGGSMTLMIKRLGSDATTHGFRSAFRDWAAETTAFAHQVCEMALAHAIGNRVEAAYRRGDLFEKRRALMDAWASFCEPGERGTVVAFLAGASPRNLGAPE